MTEKNRICELLGIRYPIIQAGMVWVSDWRLASAAANAGVLGTIGTGSMGLAEISENLDRMQDATRRPFAVNIPMLRSDAADIGALCLARGVKMFITSARHLPGFPGVQGSEPDTAG